MALLGGIFDILGAFHHYAGKGGDPKKLNKKEVKELLAEQLGLAECECPSGQMDECLKSLDEDQDGEVDFCEFMPLLAGFTILIETEKEAPSTLLKGIQTIKKVFVDYASKEGDPSTLSKHEVKLLLQEQLYGEEKLDKAKADEHFKELDLDGDAQVDIVEYFVFLATLCTCINDLL
ncbi:protein S100-A9-like isoform X2 [Protopterus annectens]|nr:protein S100-A9-like isoform X2 [Protopterus annectens]XP_043936087.1 protein S100-A9-like isoform X2 [Protopterus annectens]XP_043936088.1 protein S100-A9-like isoform X2 [Protopterus annectens]